MAKSTAYSCLRFRPLQQAGIEHLDRDAIALAREKYKEKMNQEHISKEVDAMTDEQFLAKIKLMINGKITHAGNSLYQRSGQGFCKGKEFDLQIYAKSIDVVSDGNRAI